MVALRDEVGEPYSLPAHVEVMYCLPSSPKTQFVVVHPAFEYCKSHMVLTAYYQMEYDNNPINIAIHQI